MNDDAQTELLREAVRWLRFQSIDKAKAAVSQHLDTDEKKTAFEMADGVTSARSVAPKVGVSSVTIGNWWGAWFSVGILAEHEGSYKKLFSLSDLGIPVPASATKRNNTMSAATEQSPKKVKQ